MPLKDVYGQPVQDIASVHVVSPQEAKRLRTARLKEINRRRLRRAKWHSECLAGDHGPWLQKVAEGNTDA